MPAGRDACVVRSADSCAPSGRASPWTAALLAGTVSFLSPCVLPLVPGYVSFIAGSGTFGRYAHRPYADLLGEQTGFRTSLR